MPFYKNLNVTLPGTAHLHYISEALCTIAKILYLVCGSFDIQIVEAMVLLVV